MDQRCDPNGLGRQWKLETLQSGVISSFPASSLDEYTGMAYLHYDSYPTG